ncbi:MAG: MerR family transcriptional regulator [Acidaminococcales bacterium]|jgi:DNA-binding transcriptional MerR regulator/effector-binding domain-containing protein|nr:MerR family transcriptional regulator [Acidaminococcales bacterium]
MSDYMLSIGEMAKLHGISRQTLIYYDNIGLFRPVRTTENGYRFYDKQQIPYLREIRFLKSLGINLKDIHLHFNERSPQNELCLLENQRQHILRQISRLNTMCQYLTQRVDIYKEAISAKCPSEPFLRAIEARQAVFGEYIRPINKKNLHTTLMNVWKRLFEKKMTPLCGFGSIIKKEAAESGDFLEGAGSCVFVPVWEEGGKDIIEIPAGEYLCMYKYGMPYDTEHIAKLMACLKEKSYYLCGDIIDVCLLDTTFYRRNTKVEVDLCVLQAPVKKN